MVPAAICSMVLVFLIMKIPFVSSAMDGPGFCGICHVMQPEVDTYLNSSHREVTSCGSCHVPDDFLRGGLYKSYTGTKDLLATLTGRDEFIRASKLGKDVVQENCLRCHGVMLRDIGDTKEEGGTYCFDCHRGIPHMK